MKYRGGLLICTTVLTILLGMSAVADNAKADTVTTVDPTVQTEQTTTVKPDNDDTNVDTLDPHQVNANEDSAKGIDDSLTITTPEIEQKPGGDWKVDPSEATPKNNYYYYANKDWLAEHKDDDDGTSDASLLQLQIAKDFENDLSNISAGKETADSATKSAADYYTEYLDTVNSSDVKIDSFKDDMNKIYNMKDFSDFNSQLGELIDGKYNLPFDLVIGVNYANNSKNRLNFGMKVPKQMIPMLDLDSDSIAYRSKYYEDLPKLFKLLGYDEVTSKHILDNALTFDDLLYNNSDIESVDDQMANPIVMDINDFEDHFKNVDLADYIKKSYPTATDAQITDKLFFDNFNQMMSQSYFEKMKDWMLVTNVFDNYYVFGKQGRDAVKDLLFDDPSNTSTPKDEAYNSTSTLFQTVMSIYYGKKNISEKTISRVDNVIKNIVSAYKERIQNNLWMSAEGKTNVLKKLSKIQINVGYPKTITAIDDYQSIGLSKMDNIYDMTKAINMYRSKVAKTDFDTSNEKGIWLMPTYTFNAFYNRSSNSINVLAGILKEPNYSENYSDSQLYGSLGVIIGHEISHAFDNSGSHYDENGNYRDTWTDEDRANFTTLVQKMINEYDGIPFNSIIVNGMQTVGENMADNGGMNVSLQVAKSLPGFDAKEFFTAWAKDWPMIDGPMIELRYSFDPHTISPIRTNVALQNIDDFYTTYNIKQGDPMWLDPSQRVNIW
ncbi:M13 family metallopeptidase [Companilactobacillus mishanensis]|uniref:M13 family metallopeptidase n=1 Tax=Companilactobacillus mishanensis TaxID=2486008 RepID=UPI001297F13D|nr:M13 family metallopeptidase [Companilactobacillus mishanensis]MQS89248.1 M13 family metallopeptidase [Companilactobacillus mishanensis]